MIEVSIPTWFQYFVPCNEVRIMKRVAKPITPELIYSVKGMDPETNYVVKLRLQLLESHPALKNKCRDKKCSHGWLKNLEYKSNLDSGKVWMKNGIDLSTLTVTYSKSREMLSLYAILDHYYTPVLTIVNMKTEVQEVFQFAELNFLAVNNYHNPWIQRLKTTRSWMALSRCSCSSLRDTLKCRRRMLDGDCGFYLASTGRVRQNVPKTDAWKHFLNNLEIERYYETSVYE